MIFKIQFSSFFVKAIKIELQQVLLILVNKYSIHMTDYEEITSLEQAIEELKRRDKTIANLRQINKTHQAHMEVFRRRVTELEARRNNANTQEDPRIQDLNRSLSLVNAELDEKKRENDRLQQSLEVLRRANQVSEQTKRENVRLNEMIERLRKENYQLRQQPKGKTVPKAEVQELKAEIQKLSQERQKQKSQIRNLQMELKASTEKGIAKSEKQENQLKQKQRKIAEYEKKIASLEKSNRSLIDQQRKSQVMEQQEPIKNEEIYQTVGQSSKIEFFEGVPLGESLNENHLVIPTSHAKLFSLLDTYLSRLKPKHQVQFLNLIIADSESKLDKASDLLQILSD